MQSLARRTVICDTYNSAGELALEEMPQSEPRLRADILSAQAQCLGAQGQKEQSLQKALLAKDEDPGYGNVWTQLAAAYMNVGQHEKCVECFKKAQELGMPIGKPHAES